MLRSFTMASCWGVALACFSMSLYLYLPSLQYLLVSEDWSLNSRFCVPAEAIRCNCDLIIYFNYYFYTYILLHINITTKCPNTMTQYYWIKDNALFITRAPDEPECNHLIQFSQLHFLAHVCVRPANPPVGGNAAKITENTELPGDSDPGADVGRLVSAGHPEGSNEKLICKS